MLLEKNTNMKTQNCRLCATKLIAPLFSLPNTPLANEFSKNKQLQETFPLKLVSCTNCHHYQLNYSIEADRLFNEDYVFVTGTSVVNVKYFTDYAAEAVKRFNLKEGDLVVEVASNDGTLLQAFKDLGMNVLGIDPAVNIAKEATREGIRTLPYFFTEELSEEIVKDVGKAKLVCANNVLAHLDDVADIIKGVKNLLDTNGVFIFENSYFKDMYVKNMPDLIYHEHMSHFLVYPLAAMFQANNMCFFDVENKNVHGGSIRGFVSLNKRDIFNVDDFIMAERQLGLIVQGDKNIKMSSWSQRIDALKGNLWNAINEYHNNGQKIVAYGAPAKFTTLSYMLDLNDENIAYVVDDNPLKQATFTPGKNIPVVPSTKLKQDKPDVIIVTAWNFADSIMEKCRKSGFKGKFIIPLPELRIVE